MRSAADEAEDRLFALPLAKSVRLSAMRSRVHTASGSLMLAAVAERLDQLLDLRDDLAEYGLTCGDILRLIQDILRGDMIRYPDGRMLIWDLARHDGYRIPPYPMAGCGGAREFLDDEGARNVPDWYERHIGMTREMYDAIYRYELVMVRNQALWRRVFIVPSTVLAQTDETGGELLEAEQAWLKFALGTETNEDDPLLFRR